jgi:acyl-CoA synthetase (AMP-forming)/AMP-acid ligase II
MLYDRWCGIAAEFREEIALREAATERQWSFGELHAVGERWPLSDDPIAFPQGHTPEFLFLLLAAWREAKVVCPLESGQAAPRFPLPATPVVHLKTTSATTGQPRFVAFTAEQLAADAENIVATMGLRRDWPNLGVISMAHSYGFSNLVLPLLLYGIPLVLVDSPLPEAVRRAAESVPAVTLAGVPALWRAWLEAGAISADVRLGVSAGAPLPVSVEQAVFNATGIKVHNFYGSTECGGIAYDTSAEPRTDDALAGAPMRNVELSVADTGCLTVRSRAVGATYWPEPAAELGSGQFQTNDLTDLKDGLVFLRGRASDLINVAGRKVSPGSIEQALREHPSVRDCVVFGVPDHEGDRTESIIACVVKQSSVSVEALKQFLLERLPAWQVPRKWQFVESLALNQRGKISRADWRERYLTSAPASVNSAVNTSC